MLERLQELDRRQLAYILLALIPLILVAGHFVTANKLPFCERNFQPSSSMVFEQQGSMKQVFADTEKVAIPQIVPQDDIEEFIYYAPQQDQFWYLQSGPGTETVYGPYDGKPKTCTFYTETL